MADKPHFTAAQFIEAIPGTLGIITAIANRVGCSWNTAKKYIDDYPTINAAYKQELESCLDMVETMMLADIRNGNADLMKFYLKTKGKHRGYVERHELTGADGRAIEVDLTGDEPEE